MARCGKTLWNPGKSVAENARLILPGMVAQYFQEGRDLLHGEQLAAALHKFRLRTKRMRYTLELFRPCYAVGMERRLASLRQIQNFLGAVSDSAATRRLAVDNSSPRAAQRLAKFLDARAAENLEQFRKHWRTSFDAPGQEQSWRKYLGRAARPARQASNRAG